MKHSNAAIVEVLLAIILAGVVLTFIFIVHQHQHGVTLP